MRGLRTILGVSVLSISACAHAGGNAPAPEQKPVLPPPVNDARSLPPQDAKALADFNERVTQYAQLHQKLEGTLPALPKEASPEAIDTHQRALEKLIRSARRGARPSDVITQDTRRLFRRVLARVLSGPDGRNIKATILDENPGRIQLSVNSRYPDSVPFSTVPPQVLSALPTLPQELEYRFVGERLILLDVHAHIVVDFMDDVFPR